MPLPILNKPKAAALTLSASPYIENNQIWDEGLELFHRAISQHFKHGHEYGDFELAEHLGVHRLISDEWLNALATSGRADHVARLASKFVPDGPVAPGFSLRPPKGGARVEIEIPDDLREYDPWISRELDLDIDGALLPDLFIDRFYLVTVDEHYIFRRKPRQRANRRTFFPIALSEHPRYENPAQARHYEKSAPPDNWKTLIENRAIARDD
ncbi:MULTISPECIES: hypothetical protein [unclassified Bradyrhizobium]|uniref:hypothetical protein n=1 Tax=unclassified Bradyrhizobium TaxID=2631580 RepID=UPI003396261E